MIVATERLWDPDTETLAYAAGAKVPAGEFSRLVGDAEWTQRQAVMDTSQSRGYRIETPKKTTAKKTPAKKTTARKR